jgi:hypothetical protein
MLKNKKIQKAITVILLAICLCLTGACSLPLAPSQPGSNKESETNANKDKENETDANGYVHIYNAKGLEVLKTATDGVYVLENDIDMSDAEWAHTPKQVFSGILDGNGHIIKNLTTNGLFAIFAGKVENIGFSNAKWSGAQDGIIADVLAPKSTPVISNVVIQMAEMPTGADYNKCGSIARYMQDQTVCILEDFVVEMEGNKIADKGFLFGFSRTSSKVQASNCYFVTNNMKPVCLRTELIEGTNEFLYYNAMNLDSDYSNFFSGNLTGCNFLNINVGIANVYRENFSEQLNIIYDKVCAEN